MADVPLVTAVLDAPPQLLAAAVFARAAGHAAEDYREQTSLDLLEDGDAATDDRAAWAMACALQDLELDGPVGELVRAIVAPLAHQLHGLGRALSREELVVQFSKASRRLDLRSALQ